MISYECLFKLSKNFKSAKSHLIFYDQTQNESVNRIVEIFISLVLCYFLYNIRHRIANNILYIHSLIRYFAKNLY